MLESSESIGGSRALKSGAVSRSSSRRPVSPDPFSGRGCWEDWMPHSQGVADVNWWNGAVKFLWLMVRLTSQAQTTDLETTRTSYNQCIQGLQERFESVWEKDQYLVHFHKCREDGWAKDLQMSAERVFPEKAMEHLIMTLIHLLGQERWAITTEVEVASSRRKMSQSRAVCQRLCPTDVNTMVKLDTRSGKDYACEDEPGKKTHNTGETIFVNVEGQVNSHTIGVIPGTGALMMLKRGDLWDKTAVTAEMLQPWRGPPFVGVENTLFKQAHGGTGMTVRITGENFTPRELKSERELDLNPGRIFKKEGGNVARMEDVCAPLYCCHVCCMLSVCCVYMICVS